MKVLIYGINYAPELTGVGKYSGELGEWLKNQGVDVRVITAPPYYPEWKLPSGYKPFKYQVEFIGGVQVYRCPLWIPVRQSGLRRILHLLSFAVSSLPVLVFTTVRWRPNVIFTVEPTFFCAPGTLLISKALKTKNWIHIQDFEIDAAFGLSILSNRFIRSTALRLESYILKSFDSVSTISENMLNGLKDKGVPFEKVSLFPNWSDTACIFPDPILGYQMRQELGLADEHFIILYSGNMGEKQGLDSIIAVASQLADIPNIKFVMCGDGSAKPQLIAKAQGAPNIIFLPLQPIERLNTLLNLADVHILPQRSGIADLVLPSKLTGMLASGKPVIAGASPDTSLARAVKEAGSFTYSPENLQEAIEHIINLANSPSIRAESGQMARRFAEARLSKDSILTQFMSRLVSLALK